MCNQLLYSTYFSPLFDYFLFLPSETHSLCWTRYQQNIRSGTAGSHVPWCRPDGSFSPLQVQGSLYFCINDRGDEVVGTSVDVSLGIPDCQAASTFHRFYFCNDNAHSSPVHGQNKCLILYNLAFLSNLLL